MEPSSLAPAAVDQTHPHALVLSGSWTALGLHTIGAQLDAYFAPPRSEVRLDGGRIEALDSAGAWMLRRLLLRLHDQGAIVRLHDLRPEFTGLLEALERNAPGTTQAPARIAGSPRTALASLGRKTVTTLEQTGALVGFIGESALALTGCLAHPSRLRWRPILYNIRSAGVDALPIVGVLSFLLGVVVAYQGAAQLRQYGANIFVVDLIGLSMLREFAPLITAIIIAGRSGSAYAAQIGTMAVTEEIDAMRTIGIAPLELLVVPKLIALVIALPLLTVFADLTGVLGGMIMARAQLGVGFDEFLDRFVHAVSVSTLAVGIGKAPVFAAIIAVVGCFQGFRTAGGAESVGRQTTRSVVLSIFLVIVADAMFSIAFSALDL